MSKELILERIAYASEINPQKTAQSAYMDIMLGVDNILELYKENQIANKAIVKESSLASLQEDTQEILQQANPSYLIYARDIPVVLENCGIKATAYDTVRETMGDCIFEADCSLLEANLGVANLGIINVVSSPAVPRLLSLTTDKVIFFLKKERIVRNVPEAFARIKKEHGDILPTNIIFIAGPSRTADIEFQVVFGVHGPREVFVVLY